MKAFWISALLLATCAGAFTGLSRSLVAGDAAVERDRLAAVRTVATPAVLTTPARRSQF